MCAFVLFMKGMWIRKLTRSRMGSLMRNGQLRSPRSLGTRYLRSGVDVLVFF